MLNQQQISFLKDYEKELLFNIDVEYSELLKIDELIQNNALHVIIKSPIGNDLDIFYEHDYMVLSIGEWTHTHPSTIDELKVIIAKIINDEIIIWKVTSPDGTWYSGHYDVIEWEENSAMVDKPGAMEKGDRLERSTFNKIIEDKIFE